jgi:glycosyltransferase involved in cell wall biosynthesis
MRYFRPRGVSIHRAGKTMRILMLVPHTGIRGPMPRITQVLVEALRKAGSDVSTEPWGRRNDEEGRIEKFFSRPADVLRVRRAVSSSQPQCVVVQTSHDWASIVRDLALVAGIKTKNLRIVLQFHGSRADRLVAENRRLFKRATSLLLKQVDGALVLSSDELSAFEGFYPRGRFELVRNPFEPAIKPGTRDRSSRTGSPPLLLFAGRLLREKGVLEAIDALALLNERRPAHLLIAGAGPAETELVARIRVRRLSEQVTIAGYLSPDRLRQAYADADVFLLPTYHPEGFPTVISEAMSAGLPIVTTRTRGIADFLEEGANALFVPPRDAAALAQALERLLSDYGLRERMSDANRAKVRVFAPDQVAREYLEALRRITSL